MAASDPLGPIEPTENDPRPVVRRPAAGLPGAAIFVIAVMMGLLLFLYLNGRRRETEVRPPKSQLTAFPAAPALVIPPELPSAQPAATMIVTIPVASGNIRTPGPPRAAALPAPQPISPMPPPQPMPFELPSPRPTGPALILDADVGESVRSASSGLPGTTAAAPVATGGEDSPVRTTVIRNRTTIMPMGTIIPAALETPIDSTRPGLVRAIVSRDTRGFDGREVLIPKGSRLIGEYQSEVRSGQNRVLVTWTRLIRPDGVAIRIGSPAADMMGGAGVPGHVNSFFFQRFAGAVLQSALTVGVNLASRPGNNSVIVGVPAANTAAIGQDLVPGSDLKPKITVRQGAALDVFVAHDLDFSGSLYRTQGRPH